jgi:hypothetical protein
LSLDLVGEFGEVGLDFREGQGPARNRSIVHWPAKATADISQQRRSQNRVHERPLRPVRGTSASGLGSRSAVWVGDGDHGEFLDPSEVAWVAGVEG